MSIWLWVILILVIVAVGVMIWKRMSSNQAQSRQANMGNDTGAARDYVQDREDLRSSNLSPEDRAWETASLQRERDARPKTPPPTE